jgi:hypothetical protein
MKFYLTTLALILSLVLGSCSPPADITPTPGHKTPSSLSTPAAETPTPQSSSTIEPATATIAATPANPQSNTLPADSTPGTSLANFTGKMVNGSGGGIPEGQNVTLVGLDQDKTGSYQKVLEKQSQVSRDGSYAFSGVEVSINRAFLVIAMVGGVEFQSDPILVKDSTTNFSIPITIYEQTNDFHTLSVDQVHIKFDLSAQKVIQVTELYIVSNPGKQVVVVSSDGTSIPFLQNPAGAEGVKYQLAQGSAQLLNATGGFALLPGADKQYGFLVSFSIPYARNLKYDQLFTLPVSALTVFVPQGMWLSGKQFTAAGPQTIQSQTYQMYQSKKMSAGSSLSLTLSGKPDGSSGFKFDRQTIVLICIIVVGILLIGMGIYLYLHDRARFLKEEQGDQEKPIDQDASGDIQDSIMDAMIALDDQYKAGEISKETYEERRMELKEHLKGILLSQG